MTPVVQRIRIGVGLAAVCVVIAAMFAAQAFGRSLAATVGAATNPGLGHRVVVDRRERTLYTLSPETTHHLLCVSRQCTAAWPEATVSSGRAKLTLGPGVVGHLGILRRDGVFQLTLRGRPLYRFSGDHASGQAPGNGIRSFGGTWHVVSATAIPIPAPAPAPTSAPTTNAPAMTMPAPTTTAPAMDTTPAPAPAPTADPSPAPAAPIYPGYTY
jgi:predicted lipoprotein with Yx(FWY)xxD motif